MTDGKPIDHNLEFLSVLGLTQPVTVEDVKQAYLEKAKTAHPDRGGDKQEFVRLQQAFEQATEYAQFKAGRMQWLTRWVEQYAEQQQVIDEIKALGGVVEVKADDMVTKSIGPDFATVLDRVVKIRLAGAGVDDQMLLSITSRRRVLAGLRHLELIDTAVSSVGLQNLQAFESLQHLDLSGTPVSESVLDSLLADLPQLETLNLSRTGIGRWARAKLRFSHRDLKIVG
jgi:hypothetical protein